MVFVPRVVRITEAHDKAIKAAKALYGYQFSPDVREFLDKKFNNDPKFLQDQIDNNAVLIEKIKDVNKDLKQQKLDIQEKNVKIAKQKREMTPERIDYGSQIKKDKKDKKTGGNHGSSS